MRGSEVQSSVRRVLIVEDDALIAINVEEDVRALGCDEIVVAYHHAQAFSAIAKFVPELAILDISLVDGLLDFTIADHLAEKVIPFIFYSGRLASDVPDRHRNRPFVIKPATGSTLRYAMMLALSLCD